MNVAPATKSSSVPFAVGWSEIYMVLFGWWLGLALLKFGNPGILENLIEQPTNILEWAMNPWPVVIAWWLLGALVVLGLPAVRWRANRPWKIVLLPLIWFGWQIFARTQTVDEQISDATVRHFGTCVICFYLGLFALGNSRRPNWLWIGIITAFLLVMASGWMQYFGGLAETRRYFLIYIYPTMKDVPPELWAKMMKTNRIFATLFYPNTLAGVILLLLPPIAAVIWSLERWMTVGARCLMIVVVGGAAVFCLIWSGSKGGWLLAMAMGFIGTLFLPMSRRLKISLVGAVLVLGLAGFAVKYAKFFRRGATSVVARFDYWQAALHTTARHPGLGTGPGTFGIAYKQIKRPESEMARMAHNDYLEQASDSGVPGFLFYTAFIVGFLIFTARNRGLKDDWLRLAVWLGLLGWALHSFIEFNLYVPALAWPAFTLMGWLLGQPNSIDTRPAVRQAPAS